MQDHLNRRGFTIVELLIVIVVLGVLTSIITLAFQHVQSTARDDSRETKATIIAESLERYYEKNGEYPSIPTVTTQTADELGTLLGIKDTSIFTFPRASAEESTSLTTEPPSSTRLQYNAKSANPELDTICKNEFDAGCEEFTLSWVNELDNSVRSIKSRQSGRETISTPSGLAAPSTPNVSAAAGTTSITATVTSTTCDEGAIRYKIRSWTTTSQSPPSWSSVAVSSSNTLTISSPTAGATYAFQAIAQCYIGNRDSDWSDESNIAEATIVSATTPTVTLGLSSTTLNATASVQTNACSPASSIQYNITYRVDSTTAGSYTTGTWSSSNTLSISTAAGRLYSVRAQTRCGSSGTASSYSPVALYHTIPASPTINTPSTSGSSTTWTWTAAVCATAAGWTPQYQTASSINDGSTWTGVTTSTGTSRTLTTSSVGYRYNIRAQARCSTGTNNSGWTPYAYSASTRYDRPITQTAYVRTGTIRTYRPDATNSPYFVRGQGRVHTTTSTANGSASSEYACGTLVRQIGVYTDYVSSGANNIAIKGFSDSPVEWAENTTLSFTGASGGADGNGDLDDGESFEMKFSTRCTRYDGTKQLLSGESNWIDRFGNLYLVNGTGRYHTLCDQEIPESPYCQGGGTGYNEGATATGTCTFNGSTHSFCWGSLYNANTTAWGWNR